MLEISCRSSSLQVIWRESLTMSLELRVIKLSKSMYIEWFLLSLLCFKGSSPSSNNEGGLWLQQIDMAMWVLSNSTKNGDQGWRNRVLQGDYADVHWPRRREWKERRTRSRRCSFGSNREIDSFGLWSTKEQHDQALLLYYDWWHMSETNENGEKASESLRECNQIGWIHHYSNQKALGRRRGTIWYGKWLMDHV